MGSRKLNLDGSTCARDMNAEIGRINELGIGTRHARDSRYRRAINSPDREQGLFG